MHFLGTINLLYSGLVLEQFANESARTPPKGGDLLWAVVLFEQQLFVHSKLGLRFTLQAWNLLILCVRDGRLQHLRRARPRFRNEP